MENRVAKSVEHATQQLRADFFRIDRETFSGYVADESNLDQRFIVELLLDGYPFKVGRADAYANELAIENVGDGCYAFIFTLPEYAIDQASVVEVRLANTGIPVGNPIALDKAENDQSKSHPASDVRWLGGLRFEGWCVSPAEDAPTVTATVDGERVAEAKAISWTNVGKFDSARLARRFDLYLPERFADGRVRRVQFLWENGKEFPGSPLSIVAFPDGLKSTIDRFSELESERARGEQFDRLLPMAMPFSEYPKWKARFPITVDADAAMPIAIALIGPGDPEASLSSLQSAEFQDWVVAAMPEANGHQAAYDPAQLHEFLEQDAEKCDYVIFTYSGAQFKSEVFQRVKSAFADFPDALAVYGDFDIVGSDGAEWPVCLPAFDYERLLEQGYCVHFFALPMKTVLAAVAAGVSDLYRLFIFVFEANSQRDGKVIHIPGALVTLPALDFTADGPLLSRAVADHLRARKVTAHITEAPHALFPALHVVRTHSTGLTTIVIPVRNRLELLQTCLFSIQPAVAHGNVEVLIVDNEFDRSADDQISREHKNQWHKHSTGIGRV